MCLRVERDRQAAVIFKMRTANALRCRPDVQRGGRAFWGRAIQPDPTRTDRSFIFFFIFSHARFITRGSTREIEVVTWFMSE